MSLITLMKRNDRKWIKHPKRDTLLLRGWGIGEGTSVHLSPTFIDMPGWGKQNVLSTCRAWAWVHSRKQRLQKSEDSAGNQVPIVAGLKLPMAPETALESPKLTPEPTWLSNEKAEEDLMHAVLSEAMEMYLKSILEKALTAAWQCKNLDGICLWHLQHEPVNLPMSLQLGCDVRCQIARVAVNATKTVQHMEEALEWQTNVPMQARDLTNDETL